MFSSSPLSPQTSKPASNNGPEDPDRILATMHIITVLGAGIRLGLNWKRLGKPEWVKKTVVASVFIPVISLVTVFGWVFICITRLPHANMPVLLGVPFAGLGTNFGYVWSLTRLQRGAYKRWKTEGPAALLAYEYDFGDAIRFGIIFIAAVIIIGVLLSMVLYK